MEYFPSTLTREESDALAARIEDDLAADGFGLWAVEVLDGATFAGFVGLSRVRFDPWFGPPIEVGWRLARRHWGRGFATEAASAALQFAFQQMTYDPEDDFDHPNLPVSHPLQRQVLYRARADHWRTQRDFVMAALLL